MKKIKALVLIMFVGIMAITCTKKESSASGSRENDTIEASSKDSLKAKTDSSAVTFYSITKGKYDTIISNYDKNFKGTSLVRKDFEIDKNSFNSTIASFSGKKKNLDIFFVVDENNDNNLVFKFTDKVDKKPDYLLSNGEHQYIISGKKLVSADSLNLKELVDNFQTKYKHHFGSLKSGLHTIYIRDDVNIIPTAKNNIVLKPCLNDVKQVSLATEIDGLYYNRGALWP